MQTWDDVIEVANFLKDVNWDTRVAQKIPICFHKPLISRMGQRNEGSYLLMSMYGSMTQYQGPSQGLLYNPATMEPLVSERSHKAHVWSRLACLYHLPSMSAGKVR